MGSKEYEKAGVDLEAGYDVNVAEKENAEAQNSSIPDYGFTTRENVDTSRVIALKQQLNFTEEKTSFKIEKNTTQPEKSGNTFKEQFAVAATRKEKLNVLRVFFDNSPVLKNALEKYMASITDPLNTLNALPTNVRKYLAQKLTQKGKLNEEDIYKLNLSFNEKQLLYNILKEDEKKKQAII